MNSARRSGTPGCTDLNKQMFPVFRRIKTGFVSYTAGLVLSALTATAAMAASDAEVKRKSQQ